MVSIPFTSTPAASVWLHAPTVLLARGCRCLHSAYTSLMAARPPDPYEPLRLHLAAHPGEELTLTFVELEALLGIPLPDEAWLRTWWTNAPGVPHARAWLRAGWRVRWVRRSGDQAAVTFSRSAVARP